MPRAGKELKGEMEKLIKWVCFSPRESTFGLEPVKLSMQFLEGTLAESSG